MLAWKLSLKWERREKNVLIFVLGILGDHFKKVRAAGSQPWWHHELRRTGWMQRPVAVGAFQCGHPKSLWPTRPPGLGAWGGTRPAQTSALGSEGLMGTGHGGRPRFGVQRMALPVLLTSTLGQQRCMSPSLARRAWDLICVLESILMWHYFCCKTLPDFYGLNDVLQRTTCFRQGFDLNKVSLQTQHTVTQRSPQDWYPRKAGPRRWFLT